MRINILKKESAETLWRHVTHDRTGSFAARLLRGLLWCLERPYRLWMLVRNTCYTHGYFASSQPPHSYVVSIGNLAVGGSGKTPLTQLLAEELLKLDQTMRSAAKEPLALAILSRGYRSQCEQAKGYLIFHTTPYHNPAPYLPSPFECGDEPCLLAQSLPGVWFGIGPNRLDIATRLAKKGVQLFLLDDGFQHRRLKRQCDLVLLDADRPFANQHCLPRGALREMPNALARASMIILYPVRDSAQFSCSCQQIAAYTKAPIVGMNLRVVGASQVGPAQESMQLSHLQGAKVALLCGIARPERFAATAKGLGCLIVAQEFLADHAVVSKEQLMDFCRRAVEQKAQYVLCTEKDAVKLNALDGLDFASLPLPLYFLRIQMQPVEGVEAWNALVQAIYKEACQE